MLNAKIGDTLVRITPPSSGTHGYCQSGIVDVITDTTIGLIVQADVKRRMVFNRLDGFDLAGLGSFVVNPDQIDCERKTPVLNGLDVKPVLEPTYFPTSDAAQVVIDSLPPFTPSRYIGEGNRGACKYKIVDFVRGFAIQLGDFGAYYPATTADETEIGQAA